MQNADDNDVFIAQFPIFTIANKKLVGEHGLIRAIPKTVSEDGPFIPIFTDDDLAWRFIRALKMKGIVAAGLKHAKAVATLLGEFEKIGVSRVGLDVSENRGKLSGRFCPIQEFIDNLPRDMA